MKDRPTSIILRARLLLKGTYDRSGSACVIGERRSSDGGGRSDRQTFASKRTISLQDKSDEVAMAAPGSALRLELSSPSDAPTCVSGDPGFLGAERGSLRQPPTIGPR